MNIFRNNKYFLLKFLIILATSIVVQFDAKLSIADPINELQLENKLNNQNNQTQSVPILQPSLTTLNNSSSAVSSTSSNSLLPLNAHASQSQSESNEKNNNNFNEPNKTEPYRVFFPTDDKGNIINNIVWTPEEFFRLLHKIAPDTQKLQSKNWNIESAEYVGKLTHNSLKQTLEIKDFKAIYQIETKSENITIVLPALPISAKKATLDSIPVRTTWQILNNNPATENNNRILTIEIENVTPGIHQLEIPLEPPIINGIDNSRVNFDIPKTPNAKLNLIVPLNSPTISVTESLGETSCTPISISTKESISESTKSSEQNNTPNARQLIAKIGQVTKLALSWNNDLYRNELSNAAVDSFILMQTRMSQVDIRTKFYYKITGNKIRYVNVLLDDHWQISGQFLCDEHQIDHVEIINESIESTDEIITRREIARIIFKSPIAGSFTLRAGFVLRDFSGIGHVRLPVIKPYRVTINKSLLAIQPDPLLELVLPQQGRNKSISPDWNLTNSNVSNISNDTITNIESQLAAEYDLHQIDADWKLSIKTKSIIPKVTLVQSTLLDAGDSTLQYAGEFESASEMFGQNFTLPQSVIVESIEAYDSQRNTVPVRWGRTQVAKKYNNETRIERAIFFRKPMSGKYRIVVTGHFAAKNINRTPMIEFNDVELVKHQIELYRTSALIVHADANGTVWTAENTQKNLFANAKFIGLWNSIDTKKSDNIVSPRVVISLNRPVIQGEITTILSPAPAVKPTRPTTQSTQTTPETQPESDSSDFSVTINTGNSNVDLESDSTQTSAAVTSTNHNAAWNVLFDVNLNIPSGELEQIRFQLDENIGQITNIEPTVNWTIEQHQISGRSQLIITPAKISKQQRFKIHANLSEQNQTITLPKLAPEWNNSEQVEIRNYAILPIETDKNRIIVTEIDNKENENNETDFNQSKRILWSLSNLQEVDEASQRRLMQLSPQKTESIYLAATNSEYSASIIRGGARPFVTLYDVNFYIHGNGEVFGAATLDLKNINDEKFIIAAPDNYELIRISIAGGATGGDSVSGGGIKLDRNRWQLEISGGDYPLRIGLIFRAVFNSIPMNLHLPILENVEVQETLWTISYNENAAIAKQNFNASVVGVGDNFGDKSLTSVGQNWSNRNEIKDGGRNIVTEMLGRQVPVSGENAASMLFKFDMVRLDNLLFIASGLPTPAAGKNIEIKHWFTQWEQEWTGINRTINYLKTVYPSIMNKSDDKINKILLASAADKNSSQRSISSLIGLMDSPTDSLQALQIRKERESRRLGIIVTENRVLPSLIESNPVVLCRNTMTKSGASLFGAVKGGISEIRLTTISNSNRITNRFNFLIPPTIIIVLAFTIIILILRRHKLVTWKENLKLLTSEHSDKGDNSGVEKSMFMFLGRKILQLARLMRYWHFWLLVLGCSTMIFFPAGIIIGVAIIVTILLARLRSKEQNNNQTDLRNE
ncbi:MAG: hypothetical protein LBB88_02260 [Planctomycetaceae bacterium]|jgi:hypothetical protein|nr:hypothetical protein [Planctomycetaceae bacterium]